VVLEGYADDSAETNGVYVLAGWLASAKNWKEFSDDFERAGLPCTLHMKTVRRPRGERVRKLAGLIDKWAMYRIDCVLHQGNYENIVKGKIDPKLDSPYFVLFYNVLLSAARLMDRLGWDGTINWIFDEQGKIGIEANNWYWWIKEHAKPNLKKRLGMTPVFSDDEKMLPLKAADLFAWQIRRHIEYEQPVNAEPSQVLAGCGKRGG